MNEGIPDHHNFLEVSLHMNLSWLNSFFSYETFEKERELFDCLRYLKKFFLFADDTNIYYESDNLKSLEKTVNQELKS